METENNTTTLANRAECGSYTQLQRKEERESEGAVDGHGSRRRWGKGRGDEGDSTFDIKSFCLSLVEILK